MRPASWRTSRCRWRAGACKAGLAVQPAVRPWSGQPILRNTNRITPHQPGRWRTGACKVAFAAQTAVPSGSGKSCATRTPWWRSSRCRWRTGPRKAACASRKPLGKIGRGDHARRARNAAEQRRPRRFPAGVGSLSAPLAELLTSRRCLHRLARQPHATRSVSARPLPAISHPGGCAGRAWPLPPACAWPRLPGFRRLRM